MALLNLLNNGEYTMVIIKFKNGLIPYLNGTKLHLLKQNFNHLI